MAVPHALGTVGLECRPMTLVRQMEVTKETMKPVMASWILVLFVVMLIGPVVAVKIWAWRRKEL